MLKMPISSRWRSISVVLPLLFTPAALAAVPALARAPETAAVLETIESGTVSRVGRRSLADARQRRRRGGGGGRWKAVRPWHRRQMGPAERDPLVRRRRDRGQRYREAGSRRGCGGSCRRSVSGGRKPCSPGSLPTPNWRASTLARSVAPPPSEAGWRTWKPQAFSLRPLPPQHRCPYRHRLPPHLRR